MLSRTALPPSGVAPITTCIGMLLCEPAGRRHRPRGTRSAVPRDPAVASAVLGLPSLSRRSLKAKLGVSAEERRSAWKLSRPPEGRGWKSVELGRRAIGRIDDEKRPSHCAPVRIFTGTLHGSGSPLGTGPTSDRRRQLSPHDRTSASSYAGEKRGPGDIVRISPRRRGTT